MNILILNPGSSSLRYALFALDNEVLLKGLEGSIEYEQPCENLYISRLLDSVVKAIGERRVDVCACRVVHGGAYFREPRIVTRADLDKIRELSSLAPLHNPIAAEILEECLRRFPGAAVLAAFDTGFHYSIPARASTYALPQKIVDRHAIRRYGFHGFAHQYSATKLAALTGRSIDDSRFITCHLGNGASICAIHNGRSVDTSMGLTPLEGLVMGTRCGDLDPGILLSLLGRGDLCLEDVETILTKESGLRGLSGGASDMRVIQEAANRGDERAILAIDVFSYRILKYIGAYAAVLEGVDAIAFSGGIGENSAVVREKVAGTLGWLGVKLDIQKNRSIAGSDSLITDDASVVSGWVIHVDEALQIAHEILSRLGGNFCGVVQN